MMASGRRLQLFVASTLTLCIVSHALVSPSTRATPKSAQTATSFVELIEPETKCRVVLLGCLHGSQSSASDVKDLFNDENGVDTVVLELCASRVAELRRRQPAVLESRQFSLSNFFSMVLRTSQQKGWGSGIAAAILGGASGLQTALSGVEAGLEFTTALDLAQANKCDVVLADQAVDETLKRVGNLPWTSFKMMFEEQGLAIKESEALTTAIVGDDALRPFQVNMAQVLTRNEAVVQDLLKLTLPPLAMALLAVTTAQSFVDAIIPQTSSTQQIPWWTVFQDFNMDVWNTVVMDVVSSILMLLLGYVTLALPATRVILCERDDQLTDGIRAACRNVGHKENARVIAVLGLLHVNGVAKRLLQQGDANVTDDCSR